MQRKILHVDMDAFYAAVEQRDNPELRGKPVCVGAQPGNRGVVAAASYEARKFGIHSAMPSGQAKKLCPEAVFVRPRFDAYREASLQIRVIFLEYTDMVQPLSLDEAYLDVSHRPEPATLIAREILEKIKERTGGLTASAGVSYNKFLAKVASDYNKPEGITVISPEDAQGFLDDLPIGKFYGIGKVTETRLLDLGIYTGLDLKRFSRAELVKILGKHGNFYYDMARGIDNRPVGIRGVRKSLGKSRTQAKDLTDKKEILAVLRDIAEKVDAGMERAGKKGHTVTLKVRYSNFETITRSITVQDPLKDADRMMELVTPLLLEDTQAGERPVRLLGITMSGLIENEENYVQMKLIDEM
jgi:DNA polymerase-4